MAERCHCGRSLHYNDPEVEAYMHDMVEQLGSFVKITVGSRKPRTFLVQRHYIALHGIKAEELASLGFREITDTGSRGASRT